MFNECNVVDVMDKMRAVESFDERWIIAYSAMTTLGARDFNIGEFDLSAGRIKWIASSMQDDWMERYFERHYYLDDVLLKHGLTSQSARSIDLCPQNTDLPDCEMYHSLRELGYKSVTGLTLTVQPRGNPTGASIMSDLAWAELGGDAATAAFERLASTIVAFLGAPDLAGHGPIYRPGNSVLADRQRDVLRYLADGLQYGAIAEKLGISEHTVRHHVKTAVGKLGASTREQAIAIAVRDGLIDL